MTSTSVQNSLNASPLTLPSSITTLPSIPTPLDSTVISTLQPVKLFSLSSHSSGIVTPSSSSTPSTTATTPSSSSLLVPYTSISFNPQGTFFITTSPNGSLQLFDSMRARSYKTIYSKKYGCSNATFTLKVATHSIPPSCVIASTIPASNDDISNNALRFLDINTNSFIRYFQAHTKQVTSISASPSPVFGLDAFYSASADGTVRAWDSRSDKCYACLSQMGTNPIISLDRSGTIMAIWNQDISTVILAPIENFPVGIIGKIVVDKERCDSQRIEKLAWADNGILVLDPPGHSKIVIDTLRMCVVGMLVGITNFAVAEESDDVVRNGSLDVTPDGCWCLAGSGDGSVLAWDLRSFFTPNDKNINNFENGNIVSRISPIRIRNDDLVKKLIVPRILTVNPKLNCVVTGDTEIVINTFTK